MSSREKILSSIRKNLPVSSERPSLDGPWIKYPDPVAQLTSVMEMIGGRTIRVPDYGSLAEKLQELSAYVSAKRVLNLVPKLSLPAAETAVDMSKPPHELESVGFAVLPGELAVAENAAVWVSDQQVKQRVLYFICEHLAMVVPAHRVYHNMHEAYDRIKFNGPGFGAFIAGPSKTADIEQSLVIGAHGPRSTTLFLVG